MNLSFHPSPLCTAVEEGETSESGGNWEESTIQTGERLGPYYEEIPSSHTNSMHVDPIHTDAARCTKVYSKSLRSREWWRWNEKELGWWREKNRKKCWLWREKVEMQGRWKEREVLLFSGGKLKTERQQMGCGREGEGVCVLFRCSLRCGNNSGGSWRDVGLYCLNILFFFCYLSFLSLPLASSAFLYVRLSLGHLCLFDGSNKWEKDVISMSLNAFCGVSNCFIPKCFAGKCHSSKEKNGNQNSFLTLHCAHQDDIFNPCLHTEAEGKPFASETSALGDGCLAQGHLCVVLN